MAKIITELPGISGSGVHNNLSGLNEGDYIHLTSIEKDELLLLDSRVDVLENLQNLETNFTGQAYAIWTGVGLIYDVIYPSYYIEGVLYSGATEQITLDVADPTNPRLDVIAVDATGAIKVTGEASADPVVPTLDPSTQIQISTVLINAGATTPEVTEEPIYKENLEWTTSSNNGTVNFNAVTTPFQGTKHIDCGAFTNNQYLSFIDSGSNEVTDYSILSFRVNLKSTFNNNTYFTVQFYNGATLIGSKAITSGSNNFLRTIVNTYQQVAVSLNGISFSTSTFTSIRIVMTGSNSYGYRMDNIILSIGNNVSSPLQKAIVTIVTPNGVVNATSADDVIAISGSNGTIISATGKTITITPPTLVAGTNISIDDTNPTAPIINASAVDLSGFIPLSGTTVGNPVSGDIEMEDATRIYPQVGAGGSFYLGDSEKGAIEITEYGQITVKADLLVNPTFKGMSGNNDFSQNITDLYYTQKIYVDTAITNSLPSPLNQKLLYNNSSTGIIAFGGLSINVDTAKFNVGAIEAWFINNYTDPLNPTIQYKSFPTTTGNIVPNIATQNASYLAIDVNGVLQFSSSPFENEMHRDYCILGVLVHSNRTNINVVNNQPSIALDVSSQLSDLIISLGFFNISGNVFSPNGLNLNINKSYGHIFKEGANFLNSNKDPHTLITPALIAPATIRYRLQNGTEYANTAVIDPGFYDLAGVRTAIPGTKYSIQRIYLFQSNLIRIQYGQTLYSNMADAIQAVSSESFVVEQNILENGLFRGILILRENTTNLTDTSKALFIEVSKFGNVAGLGSLSTTSLQQAYNNSTIPLITTDSVLDGFSVRNGTGAADNVTPIFKGQNTAGVNTFIVNADGNVTTSSLTVSTTPTASVGGYEVLTRNTSTGVVEKKASTFFQTALTNPITGTGTTNYLPKFTSSGVLGNSLIYDNGTNVGIGTDNPQHLLDIQTNDGYVKIGAFSNHLKLGWDNNNAITTIGSFGAQDWAIHFRQNNVSKLVISNVTGNVLINSISDNATDKLQVSGSALATAFKKSGDTDANILLAGGGVVALSSKQATLVSGTNIKTINGTSLLGSGDIVISGGSGATDLGYTPSPTNGIVTSSTGTDATIPLADATNAGLLKPAKYTVLENTTNTNSGNETESTIATINHAATAKTVLIDADEVTGQNSATSFSLIRTVWSDVWTYIKSKADTYYQLKGVRITNATTTGSYAVDWSAADVWQLTLTGNTTITDSNLPTGTATKVIELVVKGAFTITLPAYWEATPASGAYTGAKWNHFVVSCIIGTTSSEKVIYSNEVLAT